MKTTPILGLPYAESNDPAKQYPTAVDGPRALALDALIGGAGHCVATGTWSAGAAGSNTINLSSITESSGPEWALSSGALLVPRDGIYLMIYHGAAGGSMTQMWVGPGSTTSDNINGPSMSSRNANAVSLGRKAAGSAFAKPVVYTAPTAGSSGTVRLYVAHLGNPT